MYICIMVNNKRDIIQLLGTAIIFVSLLFMFSSFIDKNERQPDNTSQSELASDFQSQPEKEFISSSFQLPAVPESDVLLLKNHFYNTQKIVDVNRKIDQKLIVLQTTHLSIKPLTFNRFYFHHSKEPDDLPVLS